MRNTIASTPDSAETALLPRLGMGTASIAWPHVDADTAQEALAAAWHGGVRYYDTAPMYGAGLAEKRAGLFLSQQPRDDFRLSTKVGRLVAPDGSGVHWDFSADGIMRSVDESLERLGLDRIDVALVHDPDEHWSQAIGEALPVLIGLREQGVIGAVGVGMNDPAMLTRFVEQSDIDVVLAAAQYSLLDLAALPELLPACLRNGVAVVVAQALAGGLIDGVAAPEFHYRPAPPEIIDRARRIAAVCHRYGVPTAAAAIQFPLGHPAVTTVLFGAENATMVADDLAWSRWPMPEEVWAELVTAGLLGPDVPTPGRTLADRTGDLP